ncbi:SusC/RagA family TonB-linked outer membrane protein [Sphingobacterium psychroaquaticum]|nr:SusC/RagA family TonB-linked outer membrane protein [Sphingobacterium psychroaquaticum]
MILLFLGGLSVAFAQESITGKVTDGNGPLAGVTVTISGTTRGTSTDAEGNFDIQATRGQKLKFTLIGYTPQEFTIDGSKINVLMTTGANAINEIVVTGLGESRDKSKLGYAMTQVTGEDIRKTNAVNPIAALQGMVPGMQVNVGTGGPQATPRFLIRGAGSLNSFGNTPLIVVDGLIMDDEVVLPNRGGEQDFGNILKNFNLDDIESISVLNGGSVTALYGSRASGGVIMITTKKGYSQRGIGISLTHTQGFEDPYATAKFQDKYGTGTSPSAVYPKGQDGIEDIPANVFGYSFGPEFDGRLVRDPGGHIMKFQPNADVLKLYETGQYRNSNLALSGGNEQTTFRLSYSNSGAKGTSPNNKFDRNSIALRATHRIRNALIVDAGATYVGSVGLNPNRAFGDNSIMYGLTWGMPREYDMMHWKSQYLDAVNGGTSNLDPAGVQGLYFRLYENEQKQKEQNFRGNVNAKINFTDWLQMENLFTVNLLTTANDQLTRGQERNFNGGRYYTSNSRILQTRYHSNLNVRKNFNDFEVTFLAGAEINRTEGKGMEANTNGMRIPDIFRLSNTAGPIGYTENKPRIKQGFSLLFQGAMTYKNTLTLNVYGRNDWDSSLLYPDGHGKYSYFYPGMDAAWTFHEDLNLPSLFTFAKARFSYNIVGKGTSVYNAMTGYYLPRGNYNSLSNGELTRYGFDSNKLGNANLVPERSSTWETGLDLKMFENRFGVNFTYYQKNTKDQIIDLPVSYESGVSSALINSGNIRNRGIEARIFGTPIKKDNFSWDVAFNYTRNRSKILSLAPGVTVSSLEGDDGIRTIAEVGGEYGIMVANYGYARFQARDGSGAPIDHVNNGKYVMATNGTAGYFIRSGNYGQGLEREVRIGSTQPKFLGSIVNTFNYKAFTLSFMLDSKFGGFVYSPTYNYGSQTGQMANTLWGRKGEEGSVKYTDANGNEAWGIIPDAVFAQGSKGTGGVDIGGMTYQEAVDKGYRTPVSAYSYYANSHSWANGIRERAAFESSWIMLRDVSVSFDIPRETASKLKLNNLRLTLTGRNLGYLYNSLPDRLNPEDLVSTGAGAAFLGGGTPMTRSFAFTINTNF